MPYKYPNEEHKYPITTESYNRMISLLVDPEFKNLSEKVLALLATEHRHRQSTPTGKVRALVLAYLYEKGYPTNWLIPVFNTIKSDFKGLDYPLDDGIGLSINDNVITGNNPDKLMIMLKNDAPDTNRKITIEVTSSVSQKRLIKFIKLFWFLIEGLQKEIELPEEYKDKRNKPQLAFLIYDLKTNKGMSFSEIANSAMFEELGIFDESSIKTLYYRYLDLFVAKDKTS